MPQTYVTALFNDVQAAQNAKSALDALPGVRVRRAFLVHRDAAGTAVDGRYDGELPKIDIDHPVAMLRTMFARLVQGSSREEDGIAVDDAELKLAIGQASLVALVDEQDSTVIDDAMRALGGTVTRSDVGALDAEDTKRFLSATRIDDP